MFLRLVATAALTNGLTSAVQSSAEPKTYPKEALSSRGDLRLGLISDLNGPYGSTSYSASVSKGLHLLSELQPDLVLCAGDMVAGQNSALQILILEAVGQLSNHNSQPPSQSGDWNDPSYGQSRCVQPENSISLCVLKRTPTGREILEASEEAFRAGVRRLHSLPFSIHRKATRLIRCGD